MAAKRRKKLNKKMKELILTLLALALIAGVAALIILGTGSPTKSMAITKYYDAIGRADEKGYIAACYPKKWQKNYNPDGMEVSLSDIVSNALSYQSGATFSDLKIIKKEKQSDEVLTAFNESVKNIYGVDIGATAIYQVTFSMIMHLNNSEISEQNTGFITRYIYKCGGRWYFFADTLVSVDIGLE